jgi:hypothetical protein
MVVGREGDCRKYRARYAVPHTGGLGGLILAGLTTSRRRTFAGNLRRQRRHRHGLARGQGLTCWIRLAVLAPQLFPLSVVPDSRLLPPHCAARWACVRPRFPASSSSRRALFEVGGLAVGGFCGERFVDLLAETLYASWASGRRYTRPGLGMAIKLALLRGGVPTSSHPLLGSDSRSSTLPSTSSLPGRYYTGDFAGDLAARWLPPLGDLQRS